MKYVFLADPRIAVQRNKNDILAADIVLMNDTFENASMIGTAMEVLFAHEKDYFLNYHSHVRFNTLEEACSSI